MVEIQRKGTVSFGTVIGVIGSVLIACGIAWLIAQNWHQMPSAVKIILLLFFTGGAFTTGVLLRAKGYTGVSRAFVILGALLYTLSIFLIAQIFSTDATVQGFAYLLLLAWVGVLASAYIFEEEWVLSIALAEILVWMCTQFIAFSNYGNDLSAGMLALSFLAMGVLLYGLSLWHRGTRHAFARTYTLFTILYILLFGYIMSFQLLLPMLWENTAFGLRVVTFVCILGALAIVSLLVGALRAPDTYQKRELYGFLALFVLLLAVIGASAAVRNTVGYCRATSCYDYSTVDTCKATPAEMRCEWNNQGGSGSCQERYCWNYQTQEKCEAQTDLQCVWRNDSGYATCSNPIGADGMEKERTDYAVQQQRNTACNAYTNNYDGCSAQSSCHWDAQSGWWDGGRTTPPTLWIVWIFANIVFLAIILSVIFYGTWMKDTKIINLGIIFFSLMIVTRYLGFMIDLWGYTSLAILFISGGIVLLAGGWGIERWRRTLIADTKTETVKK